MQLCVVVWILLLVYKTGLVEQIDDLRPVSNGASLDSSVQDGSGRGRSSEPSWMLKDSRETADSKVTASNGNVPGGSHENQDELWKSLSPNHWLMLFAYYNISLTGRYLYCSLPFVFTAMIGAPEL